MADNSTAIDETHRLIASNKVEGTAVYNRDGDRLGSIYNFMVNKQSGKAEYAVMSFGGFLGMGEDYFPLPWNKLTYNPDYGGYVVDVTKEQLEKAPRYSGGQEPAFDRAYDREIDAHYRAPFI